MSVSTEQILTNARLLLKQSWINMRNVDQINEKEHNKAKVLLTKLPQGLNFCSEFAVKILSLNTDYSAIWLHLMLKILYTNNSESVQWYLPEDWEHKADFIDILKKFTANA